MSIFLNFIPKLLELMLIKLVEIIGEFLGNKIVELLERIFPQLSHNLPNIQSASRLVKWLIGVIPIIIVIVIFIFTRQIPSGELCKEELNGLSRQAEKIEQACVKVTEANPKNIGAWKRAGRAALVKWNSKRDDKQLYKTVNYFNNARHNDSKRDTDKADPQAMFYKLFMDDFEDLVKAQTPRCEKASQRYGKALKLYKKQNIFKEGDFFILAELGHFLINRDNDYKKAIQVFDKIPGNEKGYNEHILLSKAIAHALEARGIAKEDENKAKEHLEEAKKLLESSENSLRTYKSKFYLGTTYVQIANQEKKLENKISSYETAQKFYKEIAKEDVADNFYLGQRNLSFVSYLLALYKKQQNSIDDANRFFKDANDSLNKIFHDYKFLEDKPFDDSKNNRRDKKENVEFILDSYKDNVRSCSSDINRCPIQQLKDNEKKIVKMISSNSYYILHEGSEDPFFGVEHDKFYCKAVTVE